ncbi:LysR substrate-binding domain-containing protein [Mucilaginibacter sp. dw_454]|uniref:LysR family transcriptional regulator n=1 Tax=Mucilaginibacter sp. dw_454 TaxID=2720079 RepID=UPI001BD2F307|nr:LysR substrate-binding domain-containing protein [Mucilaginibacter sp. dw_454]
MDTRTLENFIKLAETLHFTKTSEQVFMAQPALSRQISQLEKSIGAELFKRNKRNVSLTKAGVYFKQAAQQTLDQLNYATNRAKQIHNGEAGEIRIGYTHSIVQSILPRIIKELRAEFPDVKTVLREMNNYEQYRDLAEQKIDIGFATNPIVPENLKSKVFFKDVFVVVLPVGHPLLKASSFNINALANEAFILPHEVDSSDYLYAIESICLDAGFLPNVVHHTSSVSSALKLVEAGLGVTIEPKASLAGQSLAIRYVELDNIPQKVHSTILWNDNTQTDHLPILNLIKKIINI